MSFLRHIKLLLWKNYVLQIRHPWVTVFEVVIPCLFVAAIATIRVQVKVTHYENSTFYESFDIYHVPNQTLQGNESSFNYITLYSPDNGTYSRIMDNVLNKLNQLNDRLFEDEFHKKFNFTGIVANCYEYGKKRIGNVIYLRRGQGFKLGFPYFIMVKLLI